MTKSTFTKQELDNAYNAKKARARNLYDKGLQSLERQAKTDKMPVKKFLQKKLALMRTFNNQTGRLRQTYNAISADIELWLPYKPKS